MELSTFVADFAKALVAADARRPQARSHRSGRIYQPGLGPHGENDAVELIAAELRQLYPERYQRLRLCVPYPNSRQKCDLAIGETPEWAIEVKMARFSGDNGKPDDTSIKDILSPYDCDRSAISDCVKLAAAEFPGRTGLLIYGFDDERRPLANIVEAFQLLARSRIPLGPLHTENLIGLVHPVFRAGSVYVWEILRQR